MTSPIPPRVLEFRYGLYSGAYDALVNRCGASELLRFHALALGCRRAAEAVELAELQVEAACEKIGPEHLPKRHGDCADCSRPGCLRPEEVERALAARARGARRRGSAA